MADHKWTTIEEQVDFAVDQIDPDRRVNVSLRDLMFVNQIVAEAVRFFHQPLHMPDLESVERFLGTKDRGWFSLLSKAQYEKLREMIPKDIEAKFGDGDLDHPLFPYYYAENEERAYSQVYEKDLEGGSD